jgi:hypothetical protein
MSGAVEALLHRVAAAMLPQPLTALDLARMEAAQVTHLATQLQVNVHLCLQCAADRVGGSSSSKVLCAPGYQQPLHGSAVYTPARFAAMRGL